MPLLPSTPTPLLLPSPDYVPSINDLYDDLMRRSLYDLVYFNGKLRPVEEIMMACCAAMGGYAPHTMLPAPAQPSSIEQLDNWARIETGILSPALQVTSDPNAGRAATEEIGALRAAVERLSASDREVIDLRHVGGMSFKEMALHLGEPLGTLLARHHRALAKLRGFLEGTAAEAGRTPEGRP